MVAGSSGQISGGKLLHPAMYAGLNVLGSVVLDFDGLRLDSRFVDTNSLVRDHFTIFKGPEHTAPDLEHEKFIPAGDVRIPERLEGFRHKKDSNANRAAALKARPWDQELLIQLRDDTADLSQKTALTWALARVGNVEVVTNFMRFVTNRFKGREISEAQEDLHFETIQALGLLAGRYEAVYEFLKRGTNPSYWQTNGFWFSPREYKSAGLAASCSIRALGISARPEALDALASLRKKGLEYKVKEHPNYVRNFSDDIANSKEHQRGIVTLVVRSVTMSSDIRRNLLAICTR